MKRFVSLLLVTLLVLSLTACNTASKQDTAATTPNNQTATENGGTEQKSGLPVLSPDNPVTISVWTMTNYSAPSADNKLSKLLKERLGVTINYEIIPPENADQKIGVLLAGGEYADLMGTTDLNIRLIKGGALIPLDDYLTEDKANLLYEHVKPYWNRLATDAGDGERHIYVLPNYNRYYGEIVGGTHYGASGFWIQKHVLEELGYPSLENMTLERYFQMIEEYMKKYPTIDGMPTIGFELLCAPGREWVLTNPPQYLAGHPNNGGVVVDENNVATIFADKEIAKRYYKFLNQMNAKGLIDKESFTQTNDQYLAKLATGRVLGMYDQRWAFGQAYDSLVAEGKYERTWVPTMPVYEGCTPYYADREVMNINQGYGISVSCKNPDIVVSFLNTMMSEEWQKLFNWGIEGEDYYVDENGRFYRTPEQREQQNDLVWRNKNKLEALYDNMPKIQGTYSDGNADSPGNQPEEFFDSLSDYDKNFLTSYGKKTWREFLNQPPENPIYYPCWNITLPEDAQVVSQQLTDLALQYLPKIIMADPSEFETLWAQYVSEINKVDVKVYEDAINAGIQERIKNWGN
ncbi:extracellular solute-binding protein family 1 [Thermoclostridium stercorarium subsp. stercorarium DSM 8532]|jgi:putative aldouronate transport system substrate-binding protein|uniref:Extracellular solute-binding protein family 1 n=3 Tax=Thermoclostridium stercorarium TaxID=1510 RepID=L7VM33_THES1|nr:extracellular solute-binding protein [Thermoclostridium stercorarium]AGC67674.1 extracellular solute-binding protein family 1 [Thermoclostridium stercorarium subsp. stercorarium DSM 8532]AGI38721.1 ABC transporter periplasmic subunit [Thermoclostridium stercorarium subsp. stercorarium DSM 8532]ANW98091.1 ABC transporter substrate-binding protein [Thermoclostridium stercorarium subsp. thermolacticum DSM 2910]ANX00635.1 ABC transporter substrate-binding protein [Thermoclostridium stercorarium 